MAQLAGAEGSIQPMTTVVANAGVPMIFWQLPVAAVALLPIVATETLIVWPILRERLLPVAGRVFTANALSTFVGIPIAWIGMVVINMITTGGAAHEFRTPMDAFRSIVLQASWLVPYEDQLHWLVPAATLILLIPYFFVSVFVERWWLRKRFSTGGVARVAVAAWVSNAVTYGGLAIYTALWLRRALPGHPAP
jgi:hypothetical protein